MIDYCCPRCKGAVQSTPQAYFCRTCDARYPIVLGIPDFRVFPDAYLDYGDDYRKGRRIAERSEQTDFRGLLEYYWSITADIPSTLVPRFTRHALMGPLRGHRLLATIEKEYAHLKRGPDSRMLELGCRTGGVLVAAAEEFGAVVGIDIAFRWLIVARKRLEEANASAQLVCCCAQFLPFRTGEFDLVVAENVIEHTEQQGELIAESHRALRPGGAFFAVTWNRYSLTPEPHVRLWGVGWLPRSLATRYVRWRRRATFDHVNLVSRSKLKRMVRRSPFSRYRIRLPVIGDDELAGLSPREKRLVRLYHKLKDWPISRSLLLLFGPAFQLICVRSSTVQTDVKT